MTFAPHAISSCTIILVSLMDVHSPDPKVESYSWDLNPSSNSLRPSISLPISQLWSPHNHHSSDKKRSHRVSLDSNNIVNKLVLDIHKSVCHSNIFKPFHKQSHTNEVHGYACFVFIKIICIYF